MNIQLNKESDLELLLNASRAKITVGSALYQLNDEKSDTDILHITAQLDSNLNSLIWTHHQFQYKKDNIDYLFTNLNQFVRNILTGDSTINFEALYTADLEQNESLSFLTDFRDQFISYNLIRSYLGLAKRDLKMFKKQKEDYKLFHLVRGVETAKYLLTNNSYTNDLKKVGIFTTLQLIKSGRVSAADKLEISAKYSQELEELRALLNAKFQAGEISRSMNTSKLMELDQEVISWNKQHTVVGSLLDKQLYDYLFTDISYNE